MLSGNDRIIVLLGITVTIIGLLGSAMFEGEAPAGEFTLFNVAFQEERELAMDHDGHTNEGHTTTLTLDVQTKNITVIYFYLSWNDDIYLNQPNDEFQLTITAPDGTNVTYDPSNSEKSTSENITIKAELNDMPQNMHNKPAASNESLAEELTNLNGIGNWTIEVKCNSAGDDNPLINDDTGNDWNLRVAVDYYKGAITEASQLTK